MHTPPQGGGDNTKDMVMTEREEQRGESTTPHHDHTSPHHHDTTTPDMTQDAAMHGSANTTHATDTHDQHHTSHDMDATHGTGHSGHAGHSEAMFQRPFWISLLLTIPVLVYAELFQDLLGYTAPQFPGSQYLEFVLGSIIYWYGGWVFLRGAIDEL